MESIINTIITTISPAALPLVVTIISIALVYFKFRSAKSARDEDIQSIHDKLLKHDYELNALKDISELHKSHLSSIDERLSNVNQELVKLNMAVEHFGKALEQQNDILMSQLGIKK